MSDHAEEQPVSIVFTSYLRNILLMSNHVEEQPVTVVLTLDLLKAGVPDILQVS